MMRPSFVVVAALMLLALLMALAIDASVVDRRWLTHGRIVSGDVLEFRAHAILMTHRAGHAGAIAADHLPYPPPFLLLIVPLSWAMSWLGPFGGFIVWILAANLLLAAVALRLGLSFRTIAIGLISPANLYCMTMGQTGIFVAAFLLAGLGLAEEMPVLAGIAAGCLVIKPQFGVLLPLCYLASRNWRAFASAALTVLTLCALTTLLFGAVIWRDFFVHQSDGAAAMLSADWMQSFQVTMVTVYMMCRSLGAGFLLSYAVQIFVSLVVAAGSFWLWRTDRPVARQLRLAITLVLAILVTPYAYTYDLPVLAMALSALVAIRQAGSPLTLAVFWLFTGFYGFFSVFWFLTGPLWLILCLALLVIPERPLWSGRGLGIMPD